jgi:hypothetical protein
MFRWSRGLVLVAILSLSHAGSARSADAPLPSPQFAGADTVGALVEAWAQAVGGWRNLGAIRSAHIQSRLTEDRIPGTSEEWVARDAYRKTVTQWPDHREEVRMGSAGWAKDWNQKVRALEGRDLRDLVTLAYLKSLLYAGFSMDSIRAAGARAAGEDSTHAFQVITLCPAGGIPLDLYIDKQTSRPARAVRKPYDDEIALAFDDWREVRGVAVPYRVREETGDGSGSNATTIASVEPGADLPASRFEAPREGAADYRFAHGRRATGIPFNFENDHIMIECSVNGSKPIWFMLDTGAGVTVINSLRLREFGLEPFGASEVMGGGNTTSFAFTRVGSLRVGGVELFHQRDGVIDLGGLERIYGMPIGGILGFDFASRFVTRVDYGTKTLDLYAPDDYADPGRGERVPFVLEQRHPHVRAMITVPDGPPIAADFVIDSGASETANLTAPFVRANRLLERARRTPAGTPHTMPGSERQFFAQTTVRGKLSSIVLGGFTLTEIPVNLQQGSSGVYASASFAGTIGERILQRFTTTYDYPRGVLVLEPNDEFAKPFPPRTTFGAALLAEGADYTTFKVTGVRKHSPAAAAGLATGDVIAAIDDKPAAAWRLAGVRAALAADGTKHVLDVVRNGGEQVRLSFTVQLVSIEDN